MSSKPPRGILSERIDKTMSSSTAYFFSNSLSCGQALAFAHTQAQDSFLREAQPLGIGLDEAELLLNASIPNHIQKTHALLIQASGGEGCFVFQKKSLHSADIEPYWLAGKEQGSLILERRSHRIGWIELDAALKSRLTEDNKIKLPHHAVALDLLLNPLCTLYKEEGRLIIERSFAQRPDLARLLNLVSSTDSSQYLGLEPLAQWLCLNEDRPPSEKTKLAQTFNSILVQSEQGQDCETLENQAVLICSDAEPCQSNGLLRSEFINPSKDMVESLKLQGLQARAHQDKLINVTEIKKAADLYFSDLMHLLKTLPA